MPETSPIQIKSAPGIKRDGTRLEGDGYIDGRWVRFDRGLPRKIAGYRSVNRYLAGPVRTVEAYTQDALVYMHFGSSRRVERMTIDQTFATGLISDRTPLTLAPDEANLWQFTVDASDPGNPLIVAQVAPNLVNITNSFGGQLFTGPLFGTDPLEEVLPHVDPVPPALDLGGLPPEPYSFTGGVFALHPYTVAFGNLGYVAWSVPGNPRDWINSGAGNANITRQKILFGMPLRGSGEGPNALLWSADSLLRMNYTGPSADGSGPVFAFDTLSVQTSVMSSSCITEYDGVYYWVGTDRFLMFNGAVREVPNTFNKDFFFDNLNWAHRQKVFVIKVPRWGEIWWCFPFGDSEEPNHAIIFNTREGTWYDTALPQAGRSAGISPGVFRYPAMTGNTPMHYGVEGATVDNAGTGYTVGDEVIVVGGVLTPGGAPAKVGVATVDGTGAIIDVVVIEPGSYLSPPPTPATVTGGTGTGGSLDLVFTIHYRLWIHEVGTDEINGAQAIPVESYFETADISMPIEQQQNKQTRVVYIEPDFVQAGPMTVQIRGNANARAPDVLGEAMEFPDTASTVNEEVVFLKEQRRQLRFRFTSNALGGNYLMGVCLAHVGPGDGTMLG